MSEEDKILNRKLQPSWSNEPTYEDLNNDKIASGTYQSTIRENLLKWEEAREGGKPIKARPGKSTVRPKLIRKQNEWKYSGLEEPFVNTSNMFEIKPRTYEDQEAAEQNALIINYQWSTKINKVKLVGDIVRTVVDEGTVIVKTGWESEEGIRVVEKEQPVYASPEESLQLMQEAIQNGEMSAEQAEAMLATGEPMQTGTEKVYVEEEALVVNQPTYEVCNNANIIIDPTCEGIIENAQFVIHEYSTSMSELKKQKYTKTKSEDEFGNVIIEETGIYRNLDLLKEDDGKYIYDEYDSESAQNYQFQDGPRKKLRAFEYWGYWDINGDGEVTPIVATWVGNTIIRMEENPFPHKRLPFSVATYMPIKKETMGEPDAELLIENQDSVGKMTRAIHDITANQAVGQEFINERFFASPVQKDNYEKGKTVYFRNGLDPRTSIHKNNIESVSPAAFQVIQDQKNDAESMSGTISFGGGNISGSALGSSATGIRSALDATSKRDLSILRRLSDLLFKDMARMTIAMNQAYLDEEEVVRITNDRFVTIRRDDLAGEFDLNIDVSTPEKDNETAERLNTMLQTNAASMNPEEARIIRAKIAKLWKMPDLAQQIEEFEPTPDPVEEQIKQLNLENAILTNQKLKKDIEVADSMIHERISRVIENETDVENKTSQMKLREAQTRKLESESDSLDQDFVERRSGQKRQMELEDKQIDFNVQQQMEQMKAQIQMLQNELNASKKQEGVKNGN